MTMADHPIVALKIKRNVEYPLVWQRMVREAPAVEPGDPVSVFDREGSFVGHGFYSPTSQIAVRILTTRRDEAIDDEFVRRRLAAAFALRRGVAGLEGEARPAYRLCNAEGDGLSGLMLDRYADLVVGEIHSAGFFRRRDLIRSAVSEAYPGCRCYFRADEETQARERFELEEQPPAPVEIEEHGLGYLVDPALGHKTGFFCDQRENRLLLRRYAAGRRVLDVCCFTGGFALNAARGGAAEVTGIDLDEKAIGWAKRNARRNGLRVEFVHVDGFGYLRDMARHGKRVDLLILDPAKLAGTREEIPKALRTHHDFHRAALPAIEAGGMLVTCSCSALVTEDAFIGTLKRAGRLARREIRILALTGPGPDHPYSLNFPEGRYLKVVWARVV